MTGTSPFRTRPSRWIAGIWTLLLLVLAACQAQPPPTATVTPNPTAAKPAGSATPRVSPTITPLPSFTLEPILNFAAPEEQSFEVEALPTREPRSATNTPVFRQPTSAGLTPGARTSTSRPATATPGGPTADRDYPVAHTITNITGHQQKYALGCEAATAVDWAGYFDVEVDEDEFQFLLPISDNPNKGFVGEVTGRWGQIPPNDYGVHADPVAEVLFNDYELNAVSYYGFTLEELKMEIAADRPVIAWVIGNVTTGQPVEYEDDEGDLAIVAAYEHVVIVTGYDESSGRIRYLNNGRTYETNEETFLASWGVLENQVIIYEE